MATDGSLRVHLLGGLDVEGLTDREVASRKGRTLLKVLALAEGTPVPVGRLSLALWPSEPPSHPADQVCVLVSRLRHVVGADRIVRTDGCYRLCTDWLDIEEVEQRVAAAERALDDGHHEAALMEATRAISLVRGPLLPDDDGDWVDPVRTHVAGTIARAHHAAAAASAATGDHVTAARAADAALTHDPYDELALRALMRAHAAAGRPSAGLARYVETRDRISDDLGVELAAETEAVHDDLVLQRGIPTDLR
ncbi:AfsR/SARP family transcriptional regulator [Aquihabitans sp. McL0605]|uniref:AfsR/SARP family transcriptional regulator n=1 Tax=Aquihabitans sp. McL0605 TaxID=3415671 RepID=UPI003CE98E9F